MAHLPIKRHIQLVTAPFSVTTADLNNDSMPDIITPNSGVDTISVFLNKGNGTYANQITYITDNGPQFCIS